MVQTLVLSRSPGSGLSYSKPKKEKTHSDPETPVAAADLEDEY
jgi:hypothetical protein